MFFQHSLLENRQTFRYRPCPIPNYFPLSSSTFRFILFDWVFQYPGHSLINMSKYGNSLDPSLPTPFSSLSEKLKLNPRSPIPSQSVASSTTWLSYTPQRTFFPSWLTTSTKCPPLIRFLFPSLSSNTILHWRSLSSSKLTFYISYLWG